MKKTLREYILTGDFDHKQAEALHRRVVEYRDTLIQRHTLQNLFLNRGSPMEDDARPTSYYDLLDACHNRTRTITHLSFLDYFISVAERIPIVIPKPRIWVPEGIIVPGERRPEQPAYELRTSSGAKLEDVEGFQEQWDTNPQVREDTKELQRRLQAAFNEYNLKLILSRMYHSSSFFVQWEGRERKLQGELAKIDWRSLYPPLDSAYYVEGNSHFSSAGGPWQRLHKDKFGRLFTLDMNQEKELVIGFKRACMEDRIRA